MILEGLLITCTVCVSADKPENPKGDIPEACLTRTKTS